MIIRNPPKNTDRNSIVKFLEVDLWSWLRDLSVGLLKINFSDNFQSFRVDIKIPPITEISIPNEFRNVYPGVVPSGRMIVRQLGNATIVDGPTNWNKDFVYLYNPSGTTVSISVIFLK
jgi:hypothetical protein